jgi:undecaprenyl-diphosphatase
MTFIQTLLIAVIQGISELFPISSVAHAVLTPFLFGWTLSPDFLQQHFLPFVVMLHLGTAIALLLYFRQDWQDFAMSLVDRRAEVARQVLIRVIIGTIPAIIIGFVLEKPLKHLFASVVSAAVFLIVNGFLLYFGEKARARGTRNIEHLGYIDALLIGVAQSLALVPGFSRSGASMIAGFWTGLSHGESARFSMLLATPIIIGASVLELPKLLHAGGGGLFMIALFGGIISGVVAFLSVWALMSWFKRHEFNAMLPFALYCWALGAVVLALSL